MINFVELKTLLNKSTPNDVLTIQSSKLDRNHIKTLNSEIVKFTKSNYDYTIILIRR
jgi:hypothetical protein